MVVVASGLVLVALDFRTRSIDVLPDVIGWLLVGAGAWMAGVGRAVPLATAAALLSLAELALPYHLALFDASTGEYIRVEGQTSGLRAVQRWEDLSQVRGAAIASAMVLGAAAAIALLRALGRRARTEGDDAAVGEVRRAMVAPAVWALAFVWVVATRVAAGERYDPVWDGGAETAGLVAAVALLALAIFLVARRDRGWAFLHRTG